MQLAVLPCIPLSIAREILDAREADRVLAEMAARWHLMEMSRHREPIYRFHPLLRDYLCRQLEQMQSTEAVNDLRRRCAASLEKHSMLEEAADLSCQTEDWPRLLRLALGMADSLIAADRYQVLQSWLQRIPGAVAGTTPWYNYWLGLCLRFDDREHGWPWSVRIHTLGRFEVLIGNVGLDLEQASHRRPSNCCRPSSPWDDARSPRRPSPTSSGPTPKRTGRTTPSTIRSTGCEN